MNLQLGVEDTLVLKVVIRECPARLVNGWEDGLVLGAQKSSSCQEKYCGFHEANSRWGKGRNSRLLTIDR